MSVGHFRPGVAARWRSNTDPALGEVPCYRNNWPEDTAEAETFFNGAHYASDPRYVTLLVTRDHPADEGRDLVP